MSNPDLISLLSFDNFGLSLDLKQVTLVSATTLNSLENISRFLRPSCPTAFYTVGQGFLFAVADYHYLFPL